MSATPARELIAQIGDWVRLKGSRQPDMSSDYDDGWVCECAGEKVFYVSEDEYTDRVFNQKGTLDVRENTFYGVRFTKGAYQELEMLATQIKLCTLKT